MRSFRYILLTAVLLTFLVGCNTFSGHFMDNLYHTDTQITSSVREVFQQNAALAQVPVNVETMHGIVRLSGYVKTIRQSDDAALLASKVPGVKSVENNLIVRK